MEQAQLSAWKEAVEYTKIPRMNWKLVLGESLTMYLKKRKYYSDDELTRTILLHVKPHLDQLKMQGWTMPKIANNLRISLSARRTEQRIYGGSR